MKVVKKKSSKLSSVDSNEVSNNSNTANSNNMLVDVNMNKKNNINKINHVNKANNLNKSNKPKIGKSKRIKDKSTGYKKNKTEL